MDISISGMRVDDKIESTADAASSAKTWTQNYVTDLWDNPGNHKTELIACATVVAGFALGGGVRLAMRALTAGNSAMSGAELTTTIPRFFGAKIHPEAMIKDWSHIHPSAVIGRSTIEDSVVRTGAVIGDGSTVKRSTIKAASVGTNNYVFHSDLDNGVITGANTRLLDADLGTKTVLGERNTVYEAILREHVTVGNDVTIGMPSKLEPRVGIGNRVSIGDRVSIAPGVSIWPRAKLGNDVTVGPNAFIGYDVRIADGAQILKNASVAH